MSEYQYYEFLAIDKPVSQDDQRWLRSLSTRADITSTRFVNTYEWGDFKGDPVKMMNRCFDAFVYVSNFGCNRLMLKIPSNAGLLKQAQAYCGGDGAKLTRNKTGFLLEFELNDEPDDLYDEDGSGWMGALSPLRNDLMNGDWRALYLAWLRNVQYETFKKDDVEPPVPAGLKKLSAPLTALADFLRIDTALIRIAAGQSAAETRSAASKRDVRTWIDALPVDAKNRIIARLMDGESVAVRGELTRQFNKAFARPMPVSGEPRRSARQLFDEWQAAVARQGERW